MNLCKTGFQPPPNPDRRVRAREKTQSHVTNLLILQIVHYILTPIGVRPTVNGRALRDGWLTLTRTGRNR
jgi:hypothetical protein